MKQRDLAKQLHDCHFKEPGKILDLGCGQGRALNEFRRLGYEVTGIDRVWDLPELNIRQGDFNKGLPFPDASFDYVLMSFSLRFVSDWHSWLRDSAERVLKPGGKFALYDTKGVFLRFFNYSPFHKAFHKRTPWYAFWPLYPYSSYLLVAEKFRDE